MFVFSYERRLRADLERWAKKGWVRADAVEAIIEDAASHEAARQGGRLPQMLGILGAVLLVAGVLMFVSANWEAISRLARLSLLLAALWGALLAGAWLKSARHGWLAEGAFVLAAGIFGASIMLISQMYHIEGHYPDALLLWGLGALLVAALAESQGALVLALGLLGWWSIAEMLDFRLGVKWLFLPPWAIGAGLVAWKRWRLGAHAVILSLLAWLFGVVNHYLDMKSIGAGLALGFMASLGAWMYAGALAAAKPARRDAHGMAAILMSYGAALAGLAPFLGQLLFDKRVLHMLLLYPVQAFAVTALLTGAAAVFGLWKGRIAWFDALALPAGALSAAGLFAGIPGGRWIMAAIVLGMSIWLITAGQRLAAKHLMRMGLALFGAEVLYVYFRTLGGLLDTSLFFLLGGALFILMAFAFVWLQGRLARGNGEAAQ